MTESENEKIVEKIFESWDQHDLEAFMSLLSDDMTYVGTASTTDKEGTRKNTVINFSTIPDSKFRIDRMVSQGNTTVVEYNMTGTNTGDWPEVRATNKKVDLPFVSIFEFEAGKVKLWKLYVDRTKWMEQLHEDILAEARNKIRQK